MGTALDYLRHQPRCRCAGAHAFDGRQVSVLHARRFARRFEEGNGSYVGKLPPDIKTGGDIKRGFVYKRVPHVTLKSIANNEEIDSIHAEFAEERR